MAKKRVAKGAKSAKVHQDETQTIDPFFGQSRAFALEGCLVNPKVRSYLNLVRNQALSTLGVDPSTTRKEQSKYKKSSLYDEEPVINQNLAQFDKNCQRWLDWFRELKLQSRENEYGTQEYSSQMLDLLMFYFKSFLQTRKTEGDSGFEGDSNLNRILILLQNHEVKLDAQDPALEIDKNWALNLADQLKAKRASNIESLDDLRQFISIPAPLPQNFNAWHYFITRTEPTQNLMLRMSADQIFRLASYLIQWLGDIPKGKHAEKLSQWTLYVLLNLENHLPAQEVSVLRDLGKKARQLKLKGIETTPKEEPFYLQVPSDFSSPQTRIEPLSAIDLTIVVVAVEYGQRDLVDWTDAENVRDHK
ncbi:LANO_0E06238g1_1 [Lachancea nothofagi CBS 11611]|uniref:LANO_0E06238g1_1 n=1 Tax=Lachancea nothofagi CBS 11611 TaxID=1266666 RepID=A0A1G4JTP1_9SACH|nr:LANO_0E06238g1_1 [Lachancea nothofagi CBS 11611]